MMTELPGKHILSLFSLELLILPKVAVQNKPPPNVSLLYADYFGQKATETLWIQEKLLPLL